MRNGEHSIENYSPATDATRDALLTAAWVQKFLKKLEQGLDRSLRYHTIDHVFDVFDEVLLLSALDVIDERTRYLMGVAALFHDGGYLTQREDNESIGAAMAREAMAASGEFSSEEIAAVASWILDTRVIRTSRGPLQIPSSKLSGYLLDADVANFGRVDFFEKAELQREELKAEPTEFYRSTLLMLQAHEWHTDAARTLLESGKQKNLERLQELSTKACQSIPARCITVRDDP